MGFEFDGFFACAEETVLADALARWPFCQGRVITAPFAGIGLALPDPDSIDLRGLAVEERQRAITQAYELFNETDLAGELREWSRHHPAVIFVHLHATCAGRCVYWGFACQDGQVLEEANGGDEALAALVRYLDVELDASGYFAPLARGYFGP